MKKGEATILFNIGSEDEDNGLIDKIDSRLRALGVIRNDKPAFISMDNSKLPMIWWGGDGSISPRLYIGAFRYIDLSVLVECILSIDILDMDFLQLIYQIDDDPLFYCWSFVDSMKDDYSKSRKR